MKEIPDWEQDADYSQNDEVVCEGIIYRASRKMTSVIRPTVSDLWYAVTAVADRKRIAELDALVRSLQHYGVKVEAQQDRRIAELEAEVAENEACNQLRWKADMRAFARWRGDDPAKQLTMPDSADICAWLFAQVEQAEARLRKLYVESTWWDGKTYDWWCAAIDEELKEECRGEKALPTTYEGWCAAVGKYEATKEG